MKLLKKYELPISPILEYAIEERISKISSNEETKTGQKKRHLEKIFKALGLDWKVEILESD